MARVLFNDSEERAIRNIKDAFRKEGLYCEVTSVGNDLRDGVEVGVLDLSKTRGPVTVPVAGAVSVDAGGSEGLEKTSFGFVSDNDDFLDHLKETVDRVVDNLEPRSPYSMPEM